MLKPVIKHRGKKREGKGFSLKELKGAKLNRQKAKKLKIPIDVRRKTVLKENIDILKEFIKDKGLLHVREKEM